MSSLRECIAFASEKHRGQKDRSGREYIHHPMYVMVYQKSLDAKKVAILHDVIEDTDATYQDLEDLGCSSKVIEAIRAITKIKGEGYQDYLERVKHNKLATAVKIQDIRQNMDLSRLNKISDKDIERTLRYAKAMQYLKEDE